MLDDPFSALDPEVVGHIVQRFLDPQGLFRRMNATDFLISKSGRFTYICANAFFYRTFRG